MKKVFLGTSKHLQDTIRALRFSDPSPKFAADFQATAKDRAKAAWLATNPTMATAPHIPPATGGPAVDQAARLSRSGCKRAFHQPGTC